MRRFSFHAKNIGSERYLTYIMGEGSELDEETLDLMEEQNVPELVSVIFEQDDDYDYLTYDVSGKTTLEKFSSGIMDKEVVLKVLRNIALGLISCKEQALHLSYILLHKGFMYIDRETLNLQFICLPVESEASVATEFKGFVRQLIANFQYDIHGDLSYVGTLLAFINGDSFNLRNLVGLTEALMEDAEIDFEQQAGISAEGDVEVISTGDHRNMPEERDITSFMMDLGGENESLPEIGDDEEEEAAEAPAPDEDMDDEVSLTDAEVTEEELQEALAEVEAEEAAARAAEEEAEEEIEAEEAAEAEADEAETAEAEAEPDQENADAETAEAAGEAEASEEQGEPEESEEPSLEELAEKARKLAEEAKQATRGTRSTAKVKVSRAALIQNAAHEAEVVEETGEHGNTELLTKEVKEVSRSSKNAKEKKNVVTEDISALNPTDLVEAETASKAAEEPAANAQTGPLTLKVNPYLIRETTEERTMINKNVFKIGKANRGVDYHVSGNGAISRQHAIITRKDDGFYIKDNKSTNHTYVNGKQLEDGEEVLLKNNSRIQLGDEEFLFKY